MNYIGLNIVIVLIGNKEDLLDSMEDDIEEAANFAKENNCLFYLASAQMNIGIWEAFDDCIRQYIEIYGFDSFKKKIPSMIKQN